MYVFLAQDETLRCLPIAFCFMRRETTLNVEFMYQKFIQDLDNLTLTLLFQISELDSDSDYDQMSARGLTKSKSKSKSKSQNLS